MKEPLEARGNMTHLLLLLKMFHLVRFVSNIHLNKENYLHQSDRHFLADL